MDRKSTGIGLAFVSLLGWCTATALAGEKDTIEVSRDALRQFNERLQQVEERLQTKEERIKNLEAQFAARGTAPEEVTHEVAQQGTRLSILEETLTKPFGGEFTFMPEGHSGPFGTNDDFYIARALDLPLLHRDPLFGQKLLGEIIIGYGRGTDEGVFASPLSLLALALG